MMKKSSSSSKCNHTHVPNKTTIKALEKSDRGEELQNFDNLKDLFASWESHAKLDIDNSSNSAKDRSAKRKSTALDIQLKKEQTERALASLQE